MEANRHRVQVHRVPTEDRSSKVWLDNDKGELFYDPIGVMSCTPQHLYFTTTNEEIKLDDWCYNTVSKAVFKCNEIDSSTPVTYYKSKGILSPKENTRKIISSSDPKLLVDYEGYEYGTGREFSAKVYLPQPSQELIKDYCEQGGFDEVEVEYELDLDNSYTEVTNTKEGKEFRDLDSYKLKLNPNNTIITHQIIEKM